MSAFLEIKELFESASAEEYLGENITLVEHMIQCAENAQADGAQDWLIVAALLHDIGHLLIPDAASAQDSGIDMHHDDVGAEWISKRFPNNIVQAVRLHVDAKKYLVATDPDYFNHLSEASQITLDIQGGVFSEAEATEFIQQQYAHEAVLLRKWDDAGKVRGAAKTDISYYEELINEVALD
jgi:phosphonate degradation associated HDIG domain protein